MNKLFTDEAWNDYQYWNETDRKQLKKINDLIKEIDRTPYDGIGKPEALKQNLKGFWSRRIDQEHRVIYKVEEDQLIFISFRYHYSKGCSR
jgi:toxin YoeB